MALDATPVLSEISLIAIILLLGLLTAIVSKRLKLPDVLLLIIVGIGLGAFSRFENIDLSLPEQFVAGLGIFTLILIVFESTAEIRFRELNQISSDALKLTIISIVTISLGITLSIWALLFRFQFDKLLISFIFGTLMAGTDPDVILSLIGKTKNKILNIIKIESILNTPFVVLLPLLIIDISARLEGGVISEFFGKLLINITSGLGAGLLIGLIVFKVMSRNYSEIYSPIAIITAAIVSYALAEEIGGNGIIAVTTLGLFFGNLEIKHKFSLLQFESVLAMLLRVLIFVLIGVIIMLPNNVWVYLDTGLLFIAYILFRYLSIHFVQKDYTFRQKLFVSCTAAKGLPVVVVTFILATTIGGFEQILSHILIFVLYTLILTSIFTRFGLGLIEEKSNTKNNKI